jgi:hypothetical protein
MRLLILALPFVFATAACKKSSSKEEPAAPVAQTPAKAPEPVESDSLKPPKTVTAVGSNGQVKVMELGKATLADTETYTVKVAIPDDLSVNKSGQVTIDVVPKTGWKLNQEFPTRLKVAPPGDVTVENPEQSPKEAAKFTEKAAAFAVNFQCASEGEKKFTADFQFAVCTESTCDPKTEKLAWTVKVAP